MLSHDKLKRPIPPNSRHPHAGYNATRSTPLGGVFPYFTTDSPGCAAAISSPSHCAAGFVMRVSVISRPLSLLLSHGCRSLKPRFSPHRCIAWKLAATVCTTQPTAYLSNTTVDGNWQCPFSGGFTNGFGTFCALSSTQYSCSGCPSLCNAGSVRNRTVQQDSHRHTSIPPRNLDFIMPLCVPHSSA